eukprot:g2974.t1
MMFGETFTEFDRKICKERTQHSLWDEVKKVNYVAKTEDEHIPFYLEHHSQPNLRIAVDGERVVATRDIQPGDFLTLDYADTEPSLYSQFPAVLTDPPLIRPWATGAHEDINEEGKKWLNIETPSQTLLQSCHTEYNDDGRMEFHGIDLLSEALSFDPDVPLYLYSKEAIRINLYRISYHLHKYFDQSDLFYSVKSNSSPEVLCELRHAGQSRLDVCSPQELDMGRRCGFDVDQMQYTGTNLSEKDWIRLSRHPDLAINLDSMSALERTPLRKHVGLRLDPDVGMSYQGNENLQCTCASKPTKMGILLSEIRQACDLARRRGVRLERIHAHVGNSFHTEDMGPFDNILSQRVAKYPAITSKRVQIEPGDSIMKNAGVMLARVTDVFEKAGSTFVGLNAGMNLNPLPAYYGSKSAVLKSGWLSKRAISGTIKNWKLRFFRLTGDTLSYYESETDFKPKGSVHIDARSEIESASDYGELCFALKTAEGVTLYAVAQSKAEYDSWMEILDHIIRKLIEAHDLHAQASNSEGTDSKSETVLPPPLSEKPRTPEAVKVKVFGAPIAAESVRKDARFARFTRMLKMHIPLPAIMMKMEAAGGFSKEEMDAFREDKPLVAAESVRKDARFARFTRMLKMHIP